MSLPPPSQNNAKQSESRVVRAFWLIVAVLSLVLAFIGAILPGLPTTVFVLISAWAAARSSPRFHQWLLNHRLFGPSLQRWEQGRLVSRRGKWTALCSMTVCAAILLWTNTPLWAAGLAITCMLCVLVWLWSRPESVKCE
ncbi:YbaN family protein [Paenalcaligenes niemegkensis]|uniref:YbaN family protein n=1 Tax=Paenalcaligenes niemegkensis TaxID=2895469 RepID=UPI001EE97CF1|nr:YbaN family protein [Paenalcaligenes niemegkensis]MCQ9617445.1 YbaN family protein [Paenalcaligenes niemegkensis]